MIDTPLTGLENSRDIDVKTVRIDLSRTPGDDVVFALVGLPGVGKSAILKALAVDRVSSDMDAYCHRNRKPYDMTTLLEMISQLPARSVISVSSFPPLINELLSAKRRNGLTNINFLYIRRPASIARDLLSLENTDGNRHDAPKGLWDFRRFYKNFDKLFLELADSMIEYQGRSLGKLTRLVHKLGFGPSATESRPKGSGAKAKVIDQVENAKLLAPYGNTLAKGAWDIIDQKTMHDITAGGYQVFDADVFPPKASARSICGRKLTDLRWRRDEFDGRSVAEIGCQLGFFTFIAADLGATEAIGLDLNPQFIAEANKMAANYRRNICKWPDDRVRFAVRRTNPGDQLPFVPDIVIANSIFHWWVIQNPEMSVEEILKWLKSLAGEAVYFEGCVTAEETVMQQHNVPVSRFNEKLFLEAASTVFSKVEMIGRCSYNPQRIVARFYN